MIYDLWMVIYLLDEQNFSQISAFCHTFVNEDVSTLGRSFHRYTVNKSFLKNYIIDYVVKR